MNLRKYQIVALSVLALALLAAPATWSQAPDGCNSAYVSDTIPATITANIPTAVTVTMNNNGTNTWLAGGQWNFGSWDAPPGPNQQQNWNSRTAVSVNVPQFSNETFSFTITAPTPGVYDATWGMVHEQQHWFGQIVQKQVTVVPGPTSITIQRGTFGTVIDAQCKRGGTLSEDPPLANQIDYNWQTFSSAPWNLTSGNTPGYRIGAWPDNALDNMGTATGTGLRWYTDLYGPRPNPGTHTMFKFDVSFIPAGSIIDAATLTLYMAHNGSAKWYKNAKLSPFVAGRDWVEGDGLYPPDFDVNVIPTFDAQGSPNHAFQKFWNVADGRNVPWGKWGATKTTAPNQDIDDSYTVLSEKTPSGNDFTANLTAIVNAWVNGALPNNGFILWGGESYESDGVTPYNGSSYRWDIASSEASTQSQRPRLVVVFHNNAPFITSPIDNVFVSTLTPTITWTSNAGGGVINHQVRVCTVDNASGAGGSIAWDSGTVAGSATSIVSGALTNNTKYWAFAREETGSGWTLWSAGAPLGNGGFNVSVLPPAVPTVTAPTGTVASPKVTVIWTGDAHSSFRVKIFTSNVSDPETASAYYDSGDVASSAFSHVCGLLPDGNYWARVKLANIVGWGAWSTGGAFTVARADWVDVLEMDETVPDLLTWDNPGGTAAWTGTVLTDPSRQDGFAKEIANMGTPSDNVWLVEDESGTCTGGGNKVLSVENPDPDGTSTSHDRSLRMHKCQDEFDLDRGVTFMWEMACQNEKDSGWTGKTWLQGTACLADKDPAGVFRMVSVQVRNDHVCMVSNTLDAMAGGGAGWTRVNLPASEGFRRFRLTGRNQIAGNYDSTVWKLYVDEVLTIQTTGTFVDNTYAVDFIAIGVGQGNMHGKWIFDWVGVNGGGDYAPGEWEPVPPATLSAGSIGGAKALYGCQCAVSAVRPVSIAWTGGNGAVITKVVTHEELQGDPPVPVTVQDGFYCQDIAGYNAACGIFVATSDTQGGAVVEGAKITSLSGVMSELSVAVGDQTFGGRAITGPSVTIEGTAPYPAVALAQKNLMGPCIDQNLGSSMDTMSILVRIFGKVTLASFTGGGNPYFYVDDGSGAVDGREEAAGVRVVLPIDAEYIPTVSDYVIVEGISVNEVVTGGTYTNVRTLLYPTATMLATGLP